MPGTRLALVLGLTVTLGFVPALRSSAQERTPAQKTYIMPAVTPAQFVKQGVDSLRVWSRAASSSARDRVALNREVRKALRMQARFADRVATIYPKEQLEWLLVTDEVADTFSTRLAPLTAAYVKAHPDEVLTEGRQFLEIELTKIPGPPPRLHGFNLLALANWAYGQIDNLGSSQTKDQVGLEDGVLRYLAEWCHLYAAVHKDAITTYETRVNQEDWIIGRIKNKCGTSKWKVTEQYFAILGTDSTVTPPVDRYAHEFHLKATDCDDERVVTIELPNFTQVQLDVARRVEEGRLSKQGGRGGN